MSLPSAEEWRELTPHLDTLLDLTGEARHEHPALLQQSQPALAQRLAVLLAVRDDASRNGFLEKVIVPTPSNGGRSGATCGPYILDSLIGRGGMGSVWKAHRSDGRYDAVVAVKLLGNATLDADAERRFRREGQILARLVHPHIAHLLDAGLTDEGQPYLVLEYVDGAHLDSYCQTHALNEAARVRLFLDVLDAVAHAHANLVVHRDVKPSNILVDGNGRVKLLDFGIAKLIDGEEATAGVTALTAVGGRLLTPLYASPEQVTGTEITTATDVYALGVVLFELLTGARPYRLQRDSQGALEEAIVTGDPIRPSDVVGDPARKRRLRGDLDTIVLKALRKQPSERYATVNAFAEDLRAWLDGRPVSAQPDSLSYRLSRLVRRHKLAVSAAAAVLLAIVGGASAAFWQARIARAEQQRAEEITGFITGIFKEADPYAGDGKSLSAADLLTQANHRLDSTLVDRPELRVEIQSIIASSLANLQEYKTAAPIIHASARATEQMYGPTDARTLSALMGLSNLYRVLGDLDAMDSVVTRVLRVVRAQARPDSTVLVKVLVDQAHLAIDRGKPTDALAPAREALALADERLPARHDLRVATAQVLSVALEQDGRDRQAALEAAEVAVERTRAKYGGAYSHPRVVEGQLALGMALGRVQRKTEAIAVLERADSASVVGMGPDNFTRAFIRGSLGLLRLEMGQELRALADYTEALRLLVANGDSTSVSHAITLGNRANILLRLYRPDEAIGLLQQSLVGLRKATGDNGPRVLPTQIRLAVAHARRGDADRAWRELESLRPRLTDSTIATPALQSAFLQAQGEVQRLRNRPREAIVLLQRAIDVRADTTAVVLAPLLADLGIAQAEAGQASATSTLRRALALFRSTGAGVIASEANAMVALATLSLDAGQTTEAQRLVSGALSFWTAQESNGAPLAAIRAVQRRLGTS